MRRMHCSHDHLNVHSDESRTYLSISMGLGGELWGLRQLGALLLDHPAYQGWRCTPAIPAPGRQRRRSSRPFSAVLWVQGQPGLQENLFQNPNPRLDNLRAKATYLLEVRDQDTRPWCIGTACSTVTACSIAVSKLHSHRGGGGLKGQLIRDPEAVQECRERPWLNYLQPHLFKPFPWDSIHTHEFWRDPSRIFFFYREGH